MPRLFDPRIVYPCDGVGPYTDVDGVVTEAGERTCRVRAPEGEFIAGYAGFPAPPVGSAATVRVYQQGGGHYPDHRLRGWVAPRR